MKIEDITKPHIESYNALFYNKVFKNIVKNIKPITIENFKMEIADFIIHQPFIKEQNNISIDRRLLPREARLTNTTYKGNLFIKFNLYYDDKLIQSDSRPCGGFPIMVKSGFCHLLDEQNPNSIDEDENDIGGYFIINGIDKLVRFHIMQKRNYAFALSRPQRNKIYTDKYICIRSVGDDELGHINYLNYSVDGDVFFRFFRKRFEFHIPVIIILRALINTTDEEIFNLVDKDNYMTVPLRKSTKEQVFSRSECIEYIGSRFRQTMGATTNEEACFEILKYYVCPHLKNNEDKFNFIIHAIRKLFALVRDDIIPDDSDSPATHEMLTETQLFANIFKDKLENLKNQLKALHVRISSRKKKKAKENDTNETESKSTLEDFMKCFKLLDCASVGKGFEHFLSTGNINIQHSSDILQNAGFCIIAERINFYRYVSHFRSVNRGSFFQDVKTTSVRKLRSESWGFFCPVHTPDGTPCGLLTHLTSAASLINTPCKFDSKILYDFGVIPAFRQFVKGVSVFYNGFLVGFTTNPKDLVSSLRSFRRKNNLQVEICHFVGLKLYESVQIYNTVSRLVRPILHKSSNMIEYIGIMEQVFLDINLQDMKIKKDNPITKADFEYKEVDNQNIFSLVASLTPFSEYNQSPRNMYQCQMAKQSMGHPVHNFKTRNDSKIYMLNYTQHPIVRNKKYDLVQDYPLGINCIVAVLSYTAYDMEDAMVINKGSMERGLFTGYVYKVDKIELPKDCYFSFLPEVGLKINTGDIFYKYTDLGGKETVVLCKSSDGYIIERIDIFQNESMCANIKFRIIRNPNIGDKFCSRHGQKGVCSMHWPSIDMPFTDSGIVPDIIINPHAFPSRMTIGMLIESMAGKAGCCEGKIQDGTPFEKNSFLDNNDDIKDLSNISIGEQLKNNGFNYFGNETMYSGITGNEFKTDIFLGVVFYQRLRHMVNDKYQVRASGAVVATTRQPVGGRKNLGGIRFGEMERDAMIAHGTPYLLNDRLLKCSDHSVFTYCCNCRIILFTNNNKCVCGGKTFNTLEMPYVFKYLCSELLAMNIRVVLDVKQPIK
ncbi:DNA-directed RNA polymerase I subunit RPA135 (RPA2) [Vairimorpha necatrix]|uniref:DNA-directed RNA polymerase subunit beta n=1 Tax=Vairimorpha necatrix TaxID=6039 RepID=A0AAX4JG31_9MICR